MNIFITRSFFLIALVALSAPLVADVYKYIDENGNVVFTDAPPAEESIEEVILPKIQTTEKYNAPLPRGTIARTESKPKASVYNVSMSPASGATIRANGGVVAVNAILDPSPDFSIRTKFFLDGVLITENSGTSASISNIARGTHNFMVEVVNADSGNSVGTASSQVTILRASIIRRQ